MSRSTPGAADRRGGWTLPALVAGLLYSVPYAFWILPLISQEPDGVADAVPARALALCQALILLLLAPHWSRLAPVGARIAFVLLVLALPWPLMVPILAAGTESIGALALAESTVLLWAVAIAAARSAAHRLPDGWRAAGSGAVQGLGLVLLLLCTCAWTGAWTGALQAPALLR